MSNPNDPTKDMTHLDKALEIAMHLGFLGLIIFWCVKIVTPFFFPILWGAIIATALYPLFQKLKKLVGESDTVAGVIFILVSLALVVAPTIWLADSVIDGASEMGRGLQEGTLAVPPPSESIREWPGVGESIYTWWSQASADLQATVAKHRDQLNAFGNKIIGGVAALGGQFVMSLFSLVIAGVLMINAGGSGRVAHAFADRLGGERGRELVNVSIATVRSVVKGVLLVGVIQSLLAAIGLVVAGVPAAGFWAILVLVVAIIQLPAILILGPIAVYVFSTSDSTLISVGFLIWSIMVSLSDNIFKPMFLGRGVAVPMLIILVGAIGGMLSSGVIGLFVGAVVLSLAYKLAELWLGDSLKMDKPSAATESGNFLASTDHRG